MILAGTKTIFSLVPRSRGKTPAVINVLETLLAAVSPQISTLEAASETSLVYRGWI